MRTLFILLASIIAITASAQQSTNTLTLNISGLETVEGKLGIQLRNSDNQIVMQKMVDVTAKDMTASFDNVEAGTYAVTYYHDANSNGELDFKWYGAPDEGTGNSNDIKGTFGPPDFEKQLFELSSSMSLSMSTLYY